MPSTEEMSSGNLSAEYYLQTLDKRTQEAYTSKNITIPLKDEGEEVVIDAINDLPEDSSELCTLLQNEDCDKEYWLIVAKAYANQGKIQEAANVIRSALSAPVILDSTSDVQSMLHGFLAWLYLTKDSKEKDSLSVDLALTEKNTAISLDPSSESNLLIDAVLALTSKKQRDRKQNYEKETRIFDNLLKRSPTNCFALLGKAKIYFYRENYLSALKVFQKILMLNPLLRPDPRIGIGLCYWFLDRKDLANQAWHNSIQVNPENNSEAKILISITKFDECFNKSVSDEDFKLKYTEALEYTKASFFDDPHNEVLHILLASYYFSKEQYDLVEKVTQIVLNNYNASNFVKSDASFWLARCKFIAKDFIQSQKLFSESLRQNPNNLLSRIGYGQCQVVRNEIGDAIRTFEKIQEDKPNILEVIYALGMLYSKNSKNVTKSILFLEKYVKLSKENSEPVKLSAFLTLSKVYENKNLNSSLEYLKMARDQELSSGKTEEELSYDLLNNIGVFSILTNEESSEKIFESAINSMRATVSDPIEREALEITLKYNIARSKETNKENEDAMKLYEEIFMSQPNYTSARIRWLFLSSLSNNGDIKDEVIELLESNKDNLEVRSFYGWYIKTYGKKYGLKVPGKDIESEHHRETLVSHDSHDCYALISLGNIYCSLARDLKVINSKYQQKQDSYYIRAAQLYMKVLGLDPFNCYAAQGIAIIFADRRQSGLALEIFRKVRDALHNIFVYINLGHCFLEVKQYAKAIESYEIALEKYSNGNDSRVLIFLGRAWLTRGLNERSIEHLKKALEYTEKSFEITKSLQTKFNVGFIKFQIADFIRKLPMSKRTIEDLEECLSGLDNAINIFNSLAEEERPPFAKEDLKARAAMGTNTLTKQLERCISEQKEYEMQAENKLKEAVKIREEESKRIAEAKQKEEELQRIEMEKLLNERKQLEEKTKEWNQLRLEEVRDENDDVDIDNEDGESKKKKKSKSSSSKKQKKQKKDFIASDEEDEMSDDDDNEDYDEGENSSAKPSLGRGGRKRSSRRSNNDDDDDEEESEKKTKKRRLTQKKSTLSKETIDDSDEELEDDLFDDENDDDEVNDDLPNEDEGEGEEEQDAGAENEEGESKSKKSRRVIDDDEDDE